MHRIINLSRWLGWTIEMGMLPVVMNREANSVSAAGQLFRTPPIPKRTLKKKKLDEDDNRPVIFQSRNTDLTETGASAYDHETRTAEVIIIEVGRGNARDKHYYGPDTIRKAATDKVFDGAQAYADHPGLDEDINRPERSVRDLIGYYFNSREVEVTRKDGTRVPALAASLKIQDGADWAIGLIKEAIDYNNRFPTQTYAGISINADGDVSPATVDGEQVNYVHRITEAFSADMVTKPARGGKFLALVESASGARRTTQQGDAVDKLIESAARLRAQIASGEIDKDEMLMHLSLIESTQSGKLSESDKFVESLDEADKAEFDKLDEAAKPAWLQSKMKMKSKEADTVDDGDEDSDVDDAVPAKKQATAAKESVRESDIAKQHPAIFSAALKEARAAVSADVEQLQAEVAELRTRQTMRESIDLAKRKLAESKLPGAAAAKLLGDLVGKDASEMDRLIEAEAGYLQLIGVKNTSKTPAGNSEKTLTLRESESKANTSFIFAGLGGN